MKITAINGSPKGINSSSNVMVESFLKGAQKAGAETEQIFLAEKNINYCTGCFSCWKSVKGGCTHEDDAQEILLNLFKSDIILFASPLYSDNISANLKAFVDRMLPLGTPYFEKDESGEYRHGDEEIRKRKMPKFIMMSNAGFPETNHFQVISNWINRFARNCRGEVLAEIYRGQGPLLTAKSEGLLPIIDNYKTLLEKAGSEVVTQEKISKELQSQLDKDLIPHEIYIKNSTQMWDNARNDN